MLLGEYRHNVDVKGRVSVPSKFRDDLGQSFVVTKGLDNCLFMYSKTEWETFEEKLKQLPLTNADARTFIRFFFAGATEVEVDKQGRINIPQVLRDYAGIKKDVVIQVPKKKLAAYRKLFAKKGLHKKVKVIKIK